MADHAVYVYAVGDAVLAESAEVSSIRGVDGSQVRVVVEGWLAALVGSVDRVRFSEESLSHRLKDVRWLAETARAHDTVVTTVARTHAVVPLRMATVYVDDDNVRISCASTRPASPTPSIKSVDAPSGESRRSRSRTRNRGGLRRRAKPNPAPPT